MLSTLLLAVLVAAPHVASPSLDLSGGARVASGAVDSVNGDDANSCRTKGAPCKTIAGLMAKPWISTARKVYLARGSHWREQLTVPTAGMRVLAYGTGDRPILDASDIINPAAWTAVGGTTNTYQTTVTLAGVSSKTWVNAWADGVFLARGAGTNLDATPGTYYINPATYTGEGTLYLHPSASGDPTTDGVVYEVSTRQFGIGTSASNVSIVSVETRNNLHNDGSLILGRDGLLVDSVIRNGQKHNALINAGSTVDGCEFVDAYFNGAAATMLILYDQAPGGRNITVRNCNLHSSTFLGATVGMAVESGGGSFGAVTYSANTVDNLMRPMSSGSSSSTVVDGLTVTNSDSGITINDTTPTVISNYTWTGTNTRAISMLGNNGSVSISNATLTSSHVAPTLIYGLGSGIQLTLNGVQFVGNGNTLAVQLGDTANLFARTCSWGGTAKYAWRVEATPTLDSDYNAFHATSAGFYYGGSMITLAAWRAATGQDAHSTPAP